MRILVVDDDKGITDFLKVAFKSECFAIDTAADGKEGSFLARTNEYDMIILDLNLPEKDGLSVCREIRDDGVKSPILILTVHSEIPTKVDLLTAGADDYMTKPFSFEELLARTKALSRRSESFEEEILKIKKLRIDSNNHEVYFKNRQIYLTRKEFILLKYLAKNIDHIVSRGAIMEHAWDMNADPFSNTIEVHIRNLRKKIGLSDLIKTVSGCGYMLDSKALND